MLMMKETFVALILIFSLPFQDKERLKNEQLFRQLYNLEGKWVMENQGSRLIEVWKKGNDSLMKGKSFVIKNNDSTLLEDVELRLLGSKILYLPTVGGQNNNRPVPFKMVFANDKEFH